MTECEIRLENNWRDSACPGYGHLVCEAMDCNECEIARSCDEIALAVDAVFAGVEGNNGDRYINI